MIAKIRPTTEAIANLGPLSAATGLAGRVNVKAHTILARHRATGLPLRG